MTPGHTQQQNGSENKWKVEIRRSLQQICWCLNWGEHRGTLIFSRCLKGGGRGYGAYFRPLGPNCRTPLCHNCPVWQSFHTEFSSVSLINILKYSIFQIQHLTYLTQSLKWEGEGVKQIRFEKQLMEGFNMALLRGFTQPQGQFELGWPQSASDICCTNKRVSILAQTYFHLAEFFST